MLQQKDLGELLKWAHRASRLERWVKWHTARTILKERRLICRIIGCTNLDSTAPCTRCGAR